MLVNRLLLRLGWGGHLHPGSVMPIVYFLIFLTDGNDDAASLDEDNI